MSHSQSQDGQQQQQFETLLAPVQQSKHVATNTKLDEYDPLLNYDWTSELASKPSLKQTWFQTNLGAGVKSGTLNIYTAPRTIRRLIVHQRYWSRLSNSLSRCRICFLVTLSGAPYAFPPYTAA
ncbi:hypothetical protein RRG08_023767 [Elysia crispata]|uniref:Uncharacterized protein n=1 Tax=Elysia crispata TaxID=231223 RepID=A0AAE1DMV2_9GAST|nr:hypothetical protein RRG08_023767 [Elysia crispata]